MHVTGDLGFSSLVLLVTSVFSLVIGLIVRRKWRRAVARKEEIRRLLVLASEETARAELEASIRYSTSTDVSVSQNHNYQNYECAVCYSPTTTRCARCKAVRYCSGKCQILHWRQGHKKECHPPSNTQGSNDEGSASGLVAQLDKYKISDDALDTDSRQQHAESLETSNGETTLSKSSVSPKVSQVKEGDFKAEANTDEEGTSTTSESSNTSFSGFSASPTRGELSDDSSTCESTSSTCESTSSTCESTSSTEPGRSGGSHTAGLNILETTSAVNDVDYNKPISPKFASLVNSVENFSKLNKPNEVKLVSSDTATSSSGLVTTNIEGEKAERQKASSGFWGQALDSVKSRNDDSALLHSNEANKSELSNSGSSLHFSFNLSGNSPSPFCVRGSEGNGMTSNETLPADSGYNKPSDAVAFTESASVDATKARNSISLNCERQNPMENGSSCGFPRDVKSSSSLTRPPPPSSSSSYVNPPFIAGGDFVKTHAACISVLRSLSSEKSNNVIDNPGNTSRLFETREPGCLSPSASVAHLSSGAGVHSIPSAKPRKMNGAQEIASCPPNGQNGSKISVWKVVDQLRGSKSSKHNSSEAGCTIAGRYNDKGLFPYELFVKLYNWNKVELQPCGLINCGNSCYANAVLQCLAFTPPLTAYFLQGLHSKACVRKEWCFMCEFENLISKAKEGKSPLSPIAIVSQLPNIGSELGNGREEDAHEFLRYAIDTMQSVCLAQAGLNASGSADEETTLMGLTFGGYLRSKIKCMKCQGKSERHERMMDLTVEIEGDIGTLEEALRQFTGTEVLDGDNKYQCSRCKSYERAKKKLTILEASNVVTIALKRFQSGKFGKLSKPIRFPEILDLAPYMSGTSDKSPVYRLYGVIVHLDIMNAAFSGHYVCYVKNIQNKWFKIDDSTVTSVDLEKVLTKGAYMLLYARCSPRAPRLIRNRIIRPDPKIKAIPTRIDGKSTGLTSRSASVNYCSSDGLANIETFYSKFQRLQRILEEDSSDSSSLLSSTSDEGSWSTDSTRDSTSTDDISDCIFGDSLRDCNSPWRNSSDYDVSLSSSSSPLYTRRPSLADSHASGFQGTSGSQTDFADSAAEGEGFWDRLPGGSRTQMDVDGERSEVFLHSDTTKQCRKLVSSSSSRETDSSRLGWFNDVKSGLTYRKSTRERTD